MTESPWTVLGLDAATATLAEVKRAYGLLIKEFRPERDPEGFQRVRTAYEEAQALLARGHDSSRGDAPGATPLASEAEGRATHQPKIPEELNLKLADLSTAISTKLRQKIRIAWAAYEETAELLRIDSEQRWSLFLQAFKGDHLLLADCCTDEQLLAHVQHNEMRLIRMATEIWSCTGDAKRLDEFCVSLNRRRDLVNTDAGLLALAVSAIALAAWAPDQATRFADRAFPKLPTSLRSELAARIDHETMIGRLIAAFPHSFKIPWLLALRDGDSQQPWQEVITKDMLMEMLTTFGVKWPGLPVLHSRLSEKAWEELKAYVTSLLR